ncbi:adenylyltransferase [Archaeoglobales archaeon]|nr:MAG: adenylyltransferase [Archaeoglobales archaeon]
MIDLNSRLERYIRQVKMPEIGENGQEKLFNSKVLVIGAGGLGSAAIAYLAAAGVGELGIVDGDTVAESNLQRQIIHAGNVGMNKAKSAKIFVEKLNPEVKVSTYPFNITPDNALDLIGEYDVIVLCPDNLPTRYLVNDACMILKKPFIHSAVYKFEGELMTVTGSPCYRCMFPDVPEELVENAVIGTTVGFFGCLQALEAIKLIVGLPVLSGKYIRINTSKLDFLFFDIEKDQKCPVCNGKLRGIYPENYTQSCKIIKF